MELVTSGNDETKSSFGHFAEQKSGAEAPH